MSGRGRGRGRGRGAPTASAQPTVLPEANGAGRGVNAAGRGGALRVLETAPDITPPPKLYPDVPITATPLAKKDYQVLKRQRAHRVNLKQTWHFNPNREPKTPLYRKQAIMSEIDPNERYYPRELLKEAEKKRKKRKLGIEEDNVEAEMLLNEDEDQLFHHFETEKEVYEEEEENEQNEEKKNEEGYDSNEDDPREIMEDNDDYSYREFDNDDQNDDGPEGNNDEGLL